MPQPDPLYWSHLSSLQLVLNSLPFSLLLLLIAVLPLHPRTLPWWEKNSNKLIVALVCGLAGMLLYWLPTHHTAEIATTYLEYAAFIALLASLYIVSGGIYISGAFAGFPWVNTLFLGIGALLANLLGTTGASMLLIRPLIRANRLRKHKVHIVIFFIFIVGNCGGLLTPLGDPPLYLGFLRGVPFFWTMRLFPEWCLTNLALLMVFHLLDEIIFNREELDTKKELTTEIAQAQHPLHIQGQHNFWFLAAILGVVWIFGSILPDWLQGAFSRSTSDVFSKLLQIATLAMIAILSWRFTPTTVHQHNHFQFAPIWEVAILFFGIFGAMIPVLAILEHNAAALPLQHTWQYFWLTGFLSSFLDNTPTYMSFAAVAAGKFQLSTEHLGTLAAQHPLILKAISTGAVFMGANTYIGNGPNFMIKSIAEHSHIKMPSFGGYMLWSMAILIPLFLLETFIFF